MNIRLHWISFVLIGSTFLQCSPDNRERPSPKRSDEITRDGKHLKIEYSSPAVRDRVIWGKLVPYDSLWRTGANEATVFSTTQAMLLEGQALDSGSYALFTVPGKEKWTVYLNRQWDQWGTTDYDSTLNVLALDILPEQTNEFSERMKFYFDDQSLVFHWVNTRFSLSIE